MNLKTFALAAAVILASAVPAAAESLCSEPIAPAAVDGAKVTAEQLHTNLVDVKTFLKQSDQYQDCVNKEWVVARDTAFRSKKELDPALTTDRDNKIKANQALKEKVGAEYNAAAQTYVKLHPSDK